MVGGILKRTSYVNPNLLSPEKIYRILSTDLDTFQQGPLLYCTGILPFLSASMLPLLCLQRPVTNIFVLLGLRDFYLLKHKKPLHHNVRQMRGFGNFISVVTSKSIFLIIFFHFLYLKIKVFHSVKTILQEMCPSKSSQ